MDSLRTGTIEEFAGFPAFRPSARPIKLTAARREALVEIIQRYIVPATSAHMALVSGHLDHGQAFRPGDLVRFRDIVCSAGAGRVTERLMQFLDGIKLSAQRKVAFLEATARGLGDDWIGDRRTFFDVTVAMGRIQALLRRICHADKSPVANRGAPSVVLACPPGEQHLFGLQIADNLFRTSGWQTTYLEPTSVAEIENAITDSAHDVLCLSWSSGFLADVVSESLRAIAAQRRAPMVLAGGYAAERNRRWLSKQGVDHVCASPRAALKLAMDRRRSRACRLEKQTSRAQQSSFGAAGDVPQVL